MAEKQEEEDGQSSWVKHKLLVSLKTTVEGLLATQSSNVWSTYGGLSRTCKDVEGILNHQLKFIVSDYGSAVDFWAFVKGLKWLNPVMTPFIQKISTGKTSYHGSTKGQIWVQESLKDHTLCTQLKILVGNKQHLHRYYYEDAFLFHDEYFQAMCKCLEAVEENRVTLLADIDAKLLSFDKSIVHLRSASMPLNTIATRERNQRSSYSESLSLAPPFISPTKESILCTSDEHAVPTSFGSSPDTSKPSAKESLRQLLRKSGSESPSGHQADGFNFYDSVNSDPLLNVDLQVLAVPPTPTSTEPNDNVALKSEAESKKVLKRSSSENLIKKQTLSRRASEMMDRILDDDSDNMFHIDANVEKRKDSEIASSLKQSRVIFSDSESMEVQKRNSPKKSAASKSKTGHKRASSDISGIKVSNTQSDREPSNSLAQKESGQKKVTSSTQNVRETQPTTGVDEVDFSSSGFFPRPVQGQSLRHYLSSQDFHTCANLDKENAHFSISEALIAAIEQMKWNHIIKPQGLMSDPEDGESDEEIKELQQRIRIRKRERLKEKGRGFPAYSDGRTDTTGSVSHSRSNSPFSSLYDSDYSDSSDSNDVNDEDIELTMDGDQNLTALKNSGLSLSLASLYSDADILKSPPGAVERQGSIQDSSSANLSAESVAISLLKKFSDKQLPKASDLQWLVTEQEAPQQLLPLPNSYPISPDDAETMSKLRSTLKGRTRLRGNMEWAPPRQQIIFNTHPPSKRSVVLVKQNYRCAGCGMRVETGYAKRYRYCEYMGKYFCQCCHSNRVSVIPGKILKKWDFSRYYVSNFAFDLLNKIQDDPLFNIIDISPELYRRVKALDNVTELRKQLHHVNSLVQMCKQASKIAKDIKHLPHHWVEDCHVYSLNDLVTVKSGQMLPQMKSLVVLGIQHILSCQFCQCFGFICEMCKNQKDIIFPFQLHKVILCQDCKTCFHKECFVPQKCPKCARIEARKQRLQEEM